MMFQGNSLLYGFGLRNMGLSSFVEKKKEAALHSWSYE